MKQFNESFRGVQFGSGYKEITRLTSAEQILGTTSFVLRDTFLGEDWVITYHCNNNGRLEIGNYSMAKEFSSPLESGSFIKLLKEKFVLHEELSNEQLVDSNYEDGYHVWEREKLRMSFNYLPADKKLGECIIYSFAIIYEHEM